MYRSHFTHEGRIVADENPSAIDLSEAITVATKLPPERGGKTRMGGVEIWSGTTLVLRGRNNLTGRRRGRRRSWEPEGACCNGQPGLSWAPPRPDNSETVTSSRSPSRAHGLAESL